jgi:type II secretory pathway pseudopilin PulG
MLRHKRVRHTEILIVILTVGVLVAMAVPWFLLQRKRGQDAVALADAKTAQTLMESCAIENDGAYTSCTLATVERMEPKLATSTLTSIDPASPRGGYTITTTSASGAVSVISRASTGEVNNP